MRSFHRLVWFWGFVCLAFGLASCRDNLDPQASPVPASPTIGQPTRTPRPTVTLEVVVSSAAPTITVTTIPSSTLSATATPTEPAPVRFAVIGDYGLAGPAEQAVAEMVLSWAPDFILTTGDNNYPDGAADTLDENVGQYFHSYIYPYQGTYGLGAESNRFFPTLGNHDWNTDSGQAYFDYFTLPGNERYYDFTWGPLHFFALDSDTREPDGVGRSSAQAAWLKEALAGSTQPWKIVFEHHPPYSSGYHGSSDWMQWPFSEWGADVVLSGHDHTYERLQVNQGWYFVVGLGGGPKYVFLFPHPGSLVRFNAAHGAMLVEATADEITFEFYAVPGELIDSYTLQAGR